MPALVPLPSPARPGEPHLWTADEYLCLGESGALVGLRIELVHGRIVDMSPQGSAHALAVDYVRSALTGVLPDDAFLRSESSFVAAGRSVPEPDVMLLDGPPARYRDALPSAARLIVEVSDSTLRYDRTTKAALYAASGVPEYWIVNLPDGCLEVHREPEAGGYRSVETLSVDDVVAPLARPDARIRVSDLLP